jgi:hypothetical protein
MERRGQTTRYQCALGTSQWNVRRLFPYLFMLFMIPDRFRWVFCQLDTLRRCMPSIICLTLDELPTTLDETYKGALEGIPNE